jgi:hypothetical protein
MIRKQLPSPSLLLASMVPPWALIMFNVIDKPNPEPPVSWLRDLSAR